MAMYLISSHKKGISSHQLSRDLDVTQKTAWFILHKVRTLFAQYDTPALEGEIELDEMYLGGRETNKHQSKKTEGTQGRSTKTKTPIFGMVERFGNARVMKVSDTKASTLRPIIEQFVAYGSHIFTDEYQAYNGLNGKYTHSVIQHGVKEYSKDGITTNSVEGFWAHFKRMVFGTYHFVSTKYLQRYIDEAVYRWNTQVNDEGERFTTMLSNAIGLCTYEQVKMVA
jgi:transposase-like protein